MALFLLIFVVPRPARTPPAVVPSGPVDIETFVAAFGPPDSQSSSEDETPRPLVVTKALTYRRQGVRAFFVPTTHQPYTNWTLVGFTDLYSGRALTGEEARRKLR